MKDKKKGGKIRVPLLAQITLIVCSAVSLKVLVKVFGVF